jgi:hypothetical protein
MNANEAAVQNAYQLAERKDIAGWINCFTEDGTFTDESIGVTYRGKELGRPVEIYATAFPNMHRELYRFFVDGDTVIVELALQGTQKGPLELPLGNPAANGQTDGRAVLRRISLEKRQDSILRLLSVRHGDLDATRRPWNLKMT